MDKETQLKSTVTHLSAMLRTVRTLNRGTPMAEVSTALEKHIKGLTLADLGLIETPAVEVPPVSVTPTPAPSPVADHPRAA